MTTELLWLWILSANSTQPEYAVILYTNHYGEFWIEVAFMIGVVGFAMLTVGSTIRRLLRKP